MTTDNKLLVEILKKDVGSLSQSLQGILLCIHQYGIRVLYTPGPQLFLIDWLSRDNHETHKEKEIPQMNLTVNSLE